MSRDIDFDNFIKYAKFQHKNGVSLDVIIQNWGYKKVEARRQNTWLEDLKKLYTDFSRDEVKVEAGARETARKIVCELSKDSSVNLIALETLIENLGIKLSQNDDV